MDNPIERVRKALTHLASGRPIILTAGADDGDGYLLLASEVANTRSTAFLIRHGCGLLCAAITDADCQRLSIPPMMGVDRRCTAIEYLVSVDACDGIGTGISAVDRATTLRRLASRWSDADSLCRPGHVIAARAHAGGILQRRAPAEAAIDLAARSGLSPSAAFTALVSTSDPTRIANTAESLEFADKHGLGWLSINDVVVYRRATEPHVRQTFQVQQAGRYGGIVSSGFHSDVSGIEYIAYHSSGQPGPSTTVVLQCQSHCPPCFSETEPSLNEPLPQTSRYPHAVVIIRCNDHLGEVQDTAADIAEILQAVGISVPIFDQSIQGIGTTVRWFMRKSRSNQSLQSVARLTKCEQ